VTTNAMGAPGRAGSGTRLTSQQCATSCDKCGQLGWPRQAGHQAGRLASRQAGQLSALGPHRSGPATASGLLFFCASLHALHGFPRRLRRQRRCQRRSQLRRQHVDCRSRKRMEYFFIYPCRKTDHRGRPPAVGEGKCASGCSAGSSANSAICGTNLLAASTQAPLAPGWNLFLFLFFWWRKEIREIARPRKCDPGGKIPLSRNVLL